MSGYLDEDSSQSSGSSALLAHLQRQSYSRHIPATTINRGRSNIHSIDEEEVDEEMYDDDGLSITTWDSEEEAKKAQEEWEESIKQLNLAFQVMVLPFFGKWLGRKWSYWAFSRFQQHGLSATFFGISWLWTPTTIIPSSAVAALQP